MKTIILFLLIGFAASAQTDSSKLPITLTFKEKHLYFMGDVLRRNNTLADAATRDSLKLYLGVGNDSARIVTTRLTAGFIIRFSEELMKLETGTGYNYFNELATATSPWSGLVAQLIIKKSQQGSEKLIATYLYDELAERFAAKGLVLTEMLSSGRAWLLNPIQQN
jgi:hypothetical protein